MPRCFPGRTIMKVAVATAVLTGPALAGDDGKYVEDGKYYTKDDEPTYDVARQSG